jgi:hypothetical protein
MASLKRFSASFATLSLDAAAISARHLDVLMALLESGASPIRRAVRSVTIVWTGLY